ncbi:MAG: Hsp20/alpha crystallin family protein [Candidatus Heimdallarchaeota archaeon]|nr:Hsp20/alpha crystallin family protein [Candidatus Heimdallarchaeota archaeon]
MTWRNRKDKERKDERNDYPFFNWFDEDFFNFDPFVNINQYMDKFMNMFAGNEEGKVVTKKFGPYYYGRIVTIGPDGKPVVKEYGNIDPRNFGFGTAEQMIGQPEDEQLIDAFIEDKAVRVIMELPGVEKEDLKITATEDKVTIKALRNGKELEAEKELSVKIKPKTAKASLKNGVLEIIFERKEPSKDKDEFEVKIE